MSRKRAWRDVSPKSGDEFANSGEENADAEDFDFTSQEDFASISRVESGTTGRQPSLVPRPFHARSARWERDKGLVPVVRACVKFYWNPGKIVIFGIF